MLFFRFVKEFFYNFNCLKLINIHNHSHTKLLTIDSILNITIDVLIAPVFPEQPMLINNGTKCYYLKCAPLA